jgi:hypothetical protein
MERLEQEPLVVERHALRAFQIRDEGWIGLDDVELAGPQAEHADVGVGAYLDTNVEKRLGAPIVVVHVEGEVLRPVPGVEFVGSGADHIGLHELVRLPSGDPAIRLHRLLADDRGDHRHDRAIEEARARLLQGDLKRFLVDHLGLGDDVAERVGRAFRQVHGHGPVPGEFHVVRGQRTAVVESHALADRKRVGKAVLGDQLVLQARNLGGERGDQIRPARPELQEPFVDLQNDGLAAFPGLDLRRIECRRLVVGAMDEDARILLRRCRRHRKQAQRKDGPRARERVLPMQVHSSPPRVRAHLRASLDRQFSPSQSAQRKGRCKPTGN